MGDALGNCEGLGYLYGSFRVIPETRFASGSAQTIRDDLLHFAKSYHQTLPMLPRGIPHHPHPIGIGHFIHRIPGICLFLRISGGISAYLLFIDVGCHQALRMLPSRQYITPD